MCTPSRKLRLVLDGGTSIGLNSNYDNTELLQELNCRSSDDNYDNLLGYGYFLKGVMDKFQINQ